MDIKQIALEYYSKSNILYDNKPYSTHIDLVLKYHDKYKHYIPEELLKNIENAICFHDVLEDCDGVVHEDIINIIGKDSFNYVVAVTNADGKNRTEKLLKTIPKILNHPESIYIKLCDRLANVKYSLKQKMRGETNNKYNMYLKEYTVFRYFLKTKNQYEKMWDELDDMMNFSDHHYLYTIKDEIDKIQRERNQHLKRYYDSWDDKKFNYTIPEPPEIDQLSEIIQDKIVKHKEILPIDFIIENLTKLGDAPSIIYDDNGNFSVTVDGWQDIQVDEPIDLNISFTVKHDSWKSSIRDALIHYLDVYYSKK